MIRLVIGTVAALNAAACTLMDIPTKSATVLQGGVVATSPTGYCVDGQSSEPQNGFAVMVPCAAIGGTQAAPASFGVATVQVGPPASAAVTGSEGAMRDFLLTDAGSAVLSQTGDAQDIKILTTQVFQSKVLVHFADAGSPPIAGLQSEEWRAFTDVNGRLVTIGLRGLTEKPLQDTSGALLLKSILSGVGAQTPAPTVAPAET